HAVGVHGVDGPLVRGDRRPVRDAARGGGGVDAGTGRMGTGGRDDRGGGHHGGRAGDHERELPHAVLPRTFRRPTVAPLTAKQTSRVAHVVAYAQAEAMAAPTAW